MISSLERAALDASFAPSALFGTNLMTIIDTMVDDDTTISTSRRAFEPTIGPSQGPGFSNPEPLYLASSIDVSPVTDKLEESMYRSVLLDHLNSQPSVIVSALPIGNQIHLVRKVGVLHGAFYSTITTLDGEEDLFLYAPYVESHNKWLPQPHVLRTSLWQARHFTGFTRFMNKMFFDFLLPYRNGILSSTSMKPTEWTLWASRLVEAIGLGHQVYLVDCKEETSTRVKTERQLVEKSVTLGDPHFVRVEANKHRYMWMVLRNT